MAEEHIILDQTDVTFKELFEGTLKEQTLKGVRIPMVQRDYAQGRESQSRVRNEFLKALHKAFTEKPITLDFVYGSIEEGVLIPLDGQQRLTTLFLLHMYAAWKDKLPFENYAFLKGFTYATRPSAREFCEKIIDKFTPSFEERISDQIQDSSWFPLDWKHDPTIASMLVMLDAINEYFADIDNLWSELVNERRITFYITGIKDMGMTDDIYIKMNSRGKPLTAFEHFKADFNRVVNNKEISLKIDTTWTNMLWPYRGEEGKPFEGNNAIIDDEFEHYFRFISDIICYKEGKEPIKELFDIAEALFTDREHVKFLVSAFDCWCGIKDINAFFDNYLSNHQYQTGKVKVYNFQTNLFLDCCKNYGTWAFGFNKMLMLYAFLLKQPIVRSCIYEDASEIDEDTFCLRIRIIRNLIWSARMEARYMKEYLTDIETIMRDGSMERLQRFPREQVAEEVEKLQWRKVHSTDEIDELHHTEDNPMLYGSIAVLGLNNVHLYPTFRILFGDAHPDFILIHRALLSIGNYGQDYGRRYQYGAVHNYSVWQSIFHKSVQRGNFEQMQNVLQQLLYKLKEANDDTSVLQTIIDGYLKTALLDWRYYMVKYKTIANHANYGMYYWQKENDPYNEIVMGSESRLSGKHWYTTLLAVYKRFQKMHENAPVELGEYGSPISFVIGENAYEMRCESSLFTIKDIQTGEINYEYINQEDNIDTEDRVKLGVSILEKKLNF